MKKILHLTLKKEWFDAIARGTKTIEYREIKPYWDRRLDGRSYDEVHFRNGYSKGVPEMVLEFIETTVDNSESGNKCWAIRLGKILSIKNWQP